MGHSKHVQKIRAEVTEAQISGVVTGLLVVLNEKMSKNPIQKVIDAIPDAMTKAFAGGKLKDTGAVSIILGATPEDLRIYFFRWERAKGGYVFTVEAPDGIVLSQKAAEAAGPERVMARNLIHEYFRQKGIVSKDTN